MKIKYNKYPGRQVLRKGSIGKLHFEVTSDNHCKNTKEDVNKLIQKILLSQKSNNLFMLGDIVNNSEGTDTTELINYTLNTLSKYYGKIIYTPGNHELRGKKNIFNGYRLNNNVLMPIGNNNIDTEINGIKITALNLLYSKNFICENIKRILGVSNKTIESIYKKIPDGRLLKMTFNEMEKLRANAVNSIKDSDIILTHGMPYPYGLKFKTLSEIGESKKELLKKIILNKINIKEKKIDKIIENETYIRNKLQNTGFGTIQFNNYDIETSKLLNLPFDEYIQGTRNILSIMGSNILGGNNFKDGVISIHGHHHSYNFQDEIVIGNKKINFLSNTIN